MSDVMLERWLAAALVAIAALAYGLLFAVALDATLFHAVPAITRVVAVTTAALGLAAVLSGVRSLVVRLNAHRRASAAVRRAELARGIVYDPVPRAFCIGLARPRVVMSTGALEHLGARELQAVRAHEEHHARRRDAMRLLIVGVVADALFFIPGIERLAQRSRDLAEIAADGRADPRGLAGAMLVMEGVGDERVDRLLGAKTSSRTMWSRRVIAGGVVVAGAFAAAVTLVAATGCADVFVGG